MKEKKKHLAGTAKVLKDSQRETDKYQVEVLGKPFVVYPNVFSPKYFFDTEFFAKEIPFREDEDFLEVGSGTGVIAVMAALKGAKRVVAVDINLDAVENTKENAKLHGVADKVEVLQGDVYEPLGDSRFDTIFWNTPFGYIEQEDITVLEKAVFDPGYKSTKKFVEGASAHLKPDGRLLIGFSKTLGHYEELESLLRQEGFILKQLAEIKSVETNPVTFGLFEARKNG